MAISFKDNVGKDMSKNRAIIYVIISALIYGYTPVLCSYSYDLGNNSFSLTFFRSLMVIPILAVIMAKDKVSFKLEKQEGFKMLFVGISSIFTVLLLYSAYTYIGVGTTTTLHFLYPLFVILICHFIYRDKITKNQIISLIIAMLGIVCFIDLKDLGKVQGMTMAIVSGITFAIYLACIEKFGLSSMNSYKLSYYLAVISSIGLFVVHLFTNQIIFNQPIESYILMLVIGILASFIGVVLLKIGIQVLGSSLASMFCLFEPISSVVFGYFFLQEKVDLIMIIGCVLIIISIGLLVKKPKETKKLF